MGSRRRSPPASSTLTASAKYSGFHALRHFYASWCINRRADGGLELPIKVVQGRLGHATHPNDGRSPTGICFRAAMIRRTGSRRAGLFRVMSKVTKPLGELACTGARHASADNAGGAVMPLLIALLCCRHRRACHCWRPLIAAHVWLVTTILLRLLAGAYVRAALWSCVLIRADERTHQPNNRGESVSMCLSRESYED